MSFQIHNHVRSSRLRFAVFFMVAFVVIFGLLNIRFLMANVQYIASPGTIAVEDSLPNVVRLLPLAGAVTEKPLPNKARLVIDSLGVNAPIVFDVTADDENIFKSLEDGVVHYTNTPKPGTRGVSIILGHSSAYPWYRGKYGSVFALLGKLKVGEKFYVQYEDGRVFVYKMKQALVFNPFANDERLAELEQNPTPSLILISCWPVGTNYRRIAIQAELVPTN